MFGGELAKLQKANPERANALTGFLTPAASSTSYAPPPPSLMWAEGLATSGVFHKEGGWQEVHV